MRKKLKLRNKFIPVNIPKIFLQDKKNIKKCLDTGWISSEGQFVKDFEKKFSIYNNRKYGVAVSSGTAALEVALKSLNSVSFKIKTTGTRCADPAQPYVVKIFTLFIAN